MRKSSGILLPSLLLALLSHPVFATSDEISIVAGVSYNLKNEDFKIGNKPFTPEFTTLEWSLIAAYKSAYLRFNFDQSIKDHSQIDNTLNGSGDPDNSIIMLGREEVGLSFGYSVYENVVLLAGFTQGETSGLTFGGYNVDQPGVFPTNARFNNTSLSIMEKGPFVGISYSYNLKDSGSFSFSAAYAQLDGEVSFSDTVTALATGIKTFSSQLIEGDANGLSYSIIWTDQFSESMLYNIGWKTTRYKFDAPDTEFDFNDVYNTMTIGFTRFF
jgi:hypothetical protein